MLSMYGCSLCSSGCTQSLPWNITRITRNLFSLTGFRLLWYQYHFYPWDKATNNRLNCLQDRAAWTFLKWKTWYCKLCDNLFSVLIKGGKYWSPKKLSATRTYLAKMASTFKKVSHEEVTKLKQAAENSNTRKSTINWVRVFDKWCEENSLQNNLEMILQANASCTTSRDV